MLLMLSRDARPFDPLLAPPLPQAHLQQASFSNALRTWFAAPPARLRDASHPPVFALFLYCIGLHCCVCCVHVA